jgi:hypothetical protein
MLPIGGLVLVASALGFGRVRCPNVAPSSVRRVSAELSTISQIPQT